MSSFNGTFNANNQAGNSIILSPGQSVSYSITSVSLTGSVVFEKTKKFDQGFKIVDTMTETDSGTYKNETSEDETVRLRCVELDNDPGSETVTWTLYDIDDEMSKEFINPITGLYEFRFTDSGAEFRRQVKITDTPTNDAHAVRKDYVDSLVNGLKWKESVKVATTVNGTLSSAFINGQTVDGVTLVTGDRILIKDQLAGFENGIYTVNSFGLPTRASDADTGDKLVSAAVHVEQGSVNADKEFVCTNNIITIDATSITFVTKGSTVNHNNLSILQGGTTNEYYHLTSTQHTAFVSMVTAGLDSLTSEEVNQLENMVTAGLGALTSEEVDQLENIGSNTITSTQWGYLGGLDQALAKANSPNFTSLGISTDSPQNKIHILAGGVSGTPAAGSTHFFIIQNTGSAGSNTEMALYSGNTGTCSLHFGDTDSVQRASIKYSHSTDVMQFFAASTQVFNALSTGIDLKSGKTLSVNGTQVVSAQGAAVSDATGGSTIDVQARTAINAVIARLEAHGLIAS